MIAIPQQLVDAECRFIRVQKRAKKAIDRDWQTENNFGADDKFLLNHLRRGGNYGVMTGPDTVIIDCDNPKLHQFIESFRDTFMVQNADNGRKHLYLQCPDAPNRFYLLEDRETKESLGDIRGPNTKRYVVGPGSIHPEGRKYTANDAALKEVSWSEIEAALKPVMEKTNKSIPENAFLGEYKAPDGLNLEAVCAWPVNGKKQANGEIQGEHPIHGSETGQNFTVNQFKEAWHCFRCESGGGPVEFLAVKEGIIRCDGARPGWKANLSSEQRVTLDEAIREYTTPGAVTTLDEHPEYEEQAYKLKCLLDEGGTHFLEKTLTYGTDVSDAYPEFWHAAALSALSVALDRRFVIRLKQAVFYPNLYIQVLGPSTIARKSTVADFLEDLVEETERDNGIGIIFPKATSPEAAIEVLAENPRRLWLLDEAGQFYAAIGKTYMATFKEFLNHIYGNKNFTRKLRAKKNDNGEFAIEDPYLNLFFATTTETFVKHSPADDLTSGWLFRITPILAEYYKPSKPFERETPESIDLRHEIFDHYKRLWKAIHRFPESNEVEFVLSDDSLAAINAFQMGLEEKAQHGENRERQLGLVGRLIPTVMKLAMIYQAGSAAFLNWLESDGAGSTYAIEHKYVVEALAQAVEYFLPVALDLHESIERYESDNIQLKILARLKRSGGRKMQHTALMRTLHLPKKIFAENIDALLESGEITGYQVKEGKAKKPMTYYVLANEGGGVEELI